MAKSSIWIKAAAIPTSAFSTTTFLQHGLPSSTRDARLWKRPQTSSDSNVKSVINSITSPALVSRKSGRSSSLCVAWISLLYGTWDFLMFHPLLNGFASLSRMFYSRIRWVFYFVSEYDGQMWCLLHSLSLSFTISALICLSTYLAP